MSRAGYERFMNEFTLDKMVEKTVRVYDEVLGQQPFDPIAPQ
jgi:hypothetical protein